MMFLNCGARRLLRAPWTAGKSNQLILKEINPNFFFFVWTDAEAEAPILWPSDAKSKLIREDSDAGRGWGQEEKGRHDSMCVCV